MKKIILTIITVLLCLGILGGGIAGIIKLTDGSMDTKKISSTKFTVGGLDTNGKYMNTNASIYTKDAFECQGLEVSLDFDNTIDYQIYFYDQNNDFVHTTGRLTGAFVKDSVPFFAKYARIVVSPKEDDVVTALEVPKYAKQLTIKVNREQGFKNYTENLLETAKTGYKFDYATGVDIVEENMDLSNYINVSSYKETMLFRGDSDVGLRVAGFYDSGRSYVFHESIAHFATLSFTSSEGINYYSIDLKNLDSSIVYMRLTWDNGSSAPQVYCR